MYTKERLINDLHRIGVKSGDRLNVKVSYKSIGRIDGGLKTVLDALIESVGENGTIFADSFVVSYPYWKMKLFPYKCVVNNSTLSYAGALANLMVSYPGALRSPHPIQKFVAIGKDADWVLEHKAGCKPYSVLHKLSQNEGKNLRIGPIDKVVGVGTTHCAIEELHWQQNIAKTGVCYYDGEILKRYYQCWPTACAHAFNSLIPIHRELGAFIGEGKVGDADAILSDMNKTFHFEMILGKQFPQYLRCIDKECYVCNIGWRGSKGHFLQVVLRKILGCKFSELKIILQNQIMRNFQPKK